MYLQIQIISFGIVRQYEIKQLFFYRVPNYGVSHCIKGAIMKYPWNDKSLSAEKRAKLLLDSLTPEEKAGLLLMKNKAIPRLGIPEYHWWNEALHGVARAGKATMFPQAIALAATFAPELVRQMGRVIAEEARIKYWHYDAHGVHSIYCGLTMFSPNINIFRDPRWGRGHETYGECPVLTSLMGAAYVQGVQGNDPEHIDCAATLKHFAVHSGPEGKRVSFDAVVNAHDLNDTYFYAFRHCVEHANPALIMTAYNALFGTPMSVNAEVLNDILRKAWGYGGVVVTDASTANNLVNEYKRYPTVQEALAAEIHAGVDVCTEGADDAHPEVLLTTEEIDRAVLNNLTLKFKLGMFDAPEALPDFTRLENSEARALSRRLSEAGIVLLKNDGILPLSPEKYRHIAVIGPRAADTSVLYANYYGRATRYTTLLDGMLDAFGEDRVLYAMGCVDSEERVHFGLANDTNMAEAQSAADAADIIILCVGINPNMEGEIGDAPNADAFGDKITLELPANQLRLIRSMASKGKPIVMLNTSGSAIHIPEEYANAVIQVFYPGPEGGHAVADILAGKVNPSGRLPVTFYESIENLPPFDDYSMANRTYRYFKGKVQYPFGYGLSYSRYAYSDLQVPKTCKAGEDIPCRVMVTNKGPYPGETAVLFFIRSECGPSVRPLKQFVGSVRIHLEPNEAKQACLNIPAEFLRIADEQGKFNYYPGPVTVIVEDVQQNFTMLV